MTETSRGDLVQVAEQLLGLLAAVDAGVLQAEVDQIAWLRGALAAIELMTGAESQLHTFETDRDR